MHYVLIENLLDRSRFEKNYYYEIIIPQERIFFISPVKEGVVDCMKRIAYDFGILFRLRRR